MGIMSETGRLLGKAACLAILFAIACAMVAASLPEPTAITVTLAGQSMMQFTIGHRSEAFSKVP